MLTYTDLIGITQYDILHYNGMLPCLLFGSGRCLLANILNAFMSWGRVSHGAITESTSMLEAA